MSVRPSETARVIARLMRVIPDDARRDVMTVLAHRITYVQPSQRREPRLGLLIDLVSDGELASVATYERERRARAAAGDERWPAASTLSRAYNGWDRAQRAAMQLHFRGGRGISDRGPAGFSSAYTRSEAITALLRFFDENGFWPTRSEWESWAQDRRRFARRHGHNDPRVPGFKQIRTLFGSLERAVELAQQDAS